MQVRFDSVRELFEDMNRHVRCTGASVMAHDDPDRRLIGWSSVVVGDDGRAFEPAEPRHWVIHIRNFWSTVDAFAPRSIPAFMDFQKSPRGRRNVMESILRLFCPRCFTFTADGIHSEEDCCVASVMGS